MKLRFRLSGSVLLEREADFSPGPGAIIRICTETYKKGLNSGSVIEFRITESEPVIFDFTDMGDVIAYIDVNDYNLIQEGPHPD